MRRLVEQLQMRTAPLALAAGVLLALASYFFVEAVVRFLLAPVVALVIGDSRFELNSFNIAATEFRYGPVLEALIVLGIVFLMVKLVSRKFPRLTSIGHNSRECPECRMDIPEAAGRCPFCTSPVTAKEPDASR
jgi:large conductance mechanosensitive channel